MIGSLAALTRPRATGTTPGAVRSMLLASDSTRAKPAATFARSRGVVSWEARTARSQRASGGRPSEISASRDRAHNRARTRSRRRIGTTAMPCSAWTMAVRPTESVPASLVFNEVVMHQCWLCHIPADSGTIVVMRAKAATRHAVALLLADNVSLFELSIALEIFGEPDALDLDAPWYQLALCGLGGRGALVRTDRGPRIALTHGLQRAATADTVIVPPHNAHDTVPRQLIDTVRRAHARGARVVSLCTGAFLLAAAGVLDGRRATTHWAECSDLARRYPRIEVDPDVLYVDNGDVLTSAGSAASLDLCLYLVRADRGADQAADLARELVVPPHRDGGQAQYIRAPLPEPRADDLFTDTLTWLQKHLADEVTIAELATRSAMSRRTFARRFVASTGTTPYHWLVRQRVQLAQQLLETTDMPIETVAAHSGFVTANNLRKHFSRIVHTTPFAYRRAFAPDPARAG